MATQIIALAALSDLGSIPRTHKPPVTPILWDQMSSSDLCRH